MRLWLSFKATDNPFMLQNFGTLYLYIIQILQDINLTAYNTEIILWNELVYTADNYKID